MTVNNHNQSEAKTRETVKKERTNTSDKPLSKRRIRIRLIPIWLRIIIVAVLIFLSLCAGAAFGYGVIGNGKPGEVFKKETWTHIIDLVEKEK